MQEETGHAQWTFPTLTTTTSGSPDSTAQAAAQRHSQSESMAAAVRSLPAQSPPTTPTAGSAGDPSPEPTPKREGGAESSTKQDDTASLDAAEAAFYSSVALSAEPVIAAAPQAAVQEDKPPVPADPAPTEEATTPTAPAPKKKKVSLMALNVQVAVLPRTTASKFPAAVTT